MQNNIEGEKKVKNHHMHFFIYLFLFFPIVNGTKVEEPYFKFHTYVIKKKNSLSQHFFEFVT
jgi:hypothetical protein